MPVLIRHPESELYIQSLDAWTSDVCQAADFETLENAFDFCFALELRDVQIDITASSVWEPPHEEDGISS